MLRFMIKLPFRIIAAPVWLVLAAVNIVLVFLVGLSAGFCYLIAGISVVTEVLSTQVIDGRQCLVIQIDERLEVNGISVNPDTGEVIDRTAEGYVEE